MQPESGEPAGPSQEVSTLFGSGYWEERWRTGDHATQSMSSAPPNPHLVREIQNLEPGTALEAGCGAGNEAQWLASTGWRVVAVDVSAAALETAATKAQASGLDDRISWVDADLTTWEPDTRFDLVTTHYAHPSMPQVDFYERLAAWVKPGGTLFIVGHLHAPDQEHDHGHGVDHEHLHATGHNDPSDPQPPHEATATAERITSQLHPSRWQIVTAQEGIRVVPRHGGGETRLRDVVVRAKLRR